MIYFFRVPNLTTTYIASDGRVMNGELGKDFKGGGMA
jgi:hypothetical protein